MSRFWFGKNGNSKPSRQSRSGFRPSLETLEDRWVPAGPAGASIYQFSVTEYTVLESSGATQLTGAVLRTNDLSATTTVQIASRDESAIAGTNYMAVVPTTITFAPGETSKNVSITIIDDSSPPPPAVPTAGFNGNKSFGLELFNPSPGDVVGSPGAAAVLIRDTTGTANQRYVNFVYQEVLNRQSDTGGRGFWVGQIEAGATRTSVALSFLNSAEGRSVYVQDLYIQYLNRPADAGGLQNFVNFLNNGGTRQALTAIFLGSVEYYSVINNGNGTINSANNSAFLVSLYQTQLDRNPDPIAFNQFLQNLNSVPPAQAQQARQGQAFAFVQSDEAYGILVNSWYQIYLNRNADPGGFTSNFDALKAGTRIETLISNFLGSAEYFAFV